MASGYSEKNSKNSFKNLENLEQFFLIVEVFFFQKTKISMEELERFDHYINIA
jgi:hypothetical protein